MHHRQGDSGSQLHAEVTVRNAVQTVAAHLSKAQQVSSHAAIQRIGSACQRAGAQRHYIHALHGILHPADITEEHLSIGQQMVAKGDGLRPLQMGISGHDGLAVFHGLVGQHGAQLFQLADKPGGFLFQRHADIQGYLIVPAPGSVQPLTGAAQTLGEFALHKGVDVLGVGVDGQCARSDLIADFLQLVANLLRLRFVDDSAGSQHSSVGDAPADILLIHTAVKGNRRVKVVGFGVKLLVEASCP